MQPPITNNSFINPTSFKQSSFHHPPSIQQST